MVRTTTDPSALAGIDNGLMPKWIAVFAQVTLGIVGDAPAAAQDTEGASA
jgi:hypothetical protein